MPNAKYPHTKWKSKNKSYTSLADEQNKIVLLQVYLVLVLKCKSSQCFGGTQQLVIFILSHASKTDVLI